MEQRVVTKQLAGVEDFISGIGKVSQIRGTGSKIITKLNASEIQGALVVDTISELESMPVSDLGKTKTIIVSDKNRGGIFTYDDSKSDINNYGTIFNGWVRQYDDIVNVKWFGAKGDGSTDDTEAIQKTLDLNLAAFLPSGTYRISDTLVLSNGFYGSSLIGEDRQNTKILTSVTGSKPILSLNGGSGAFSNIEVKNLTLRSTNNVSATAIYVNGQGNANFERLKIEDCKYGIWLHNNSTNAFTEVNNFNDIVIDYCDNGVRIEKGSGSDSFHGNSFDKVYMNVGANQIGFNLVSGYYYNGRINLFMWSHDTTSVYINADGNGEHIQGTLTYESFATGQFTGIGRFWVSGFLDGIGGVTDNTIQGSSTEENIAFNNYNKGKTQSTLNTTISPIVDYGKRLDGGDYNLYSSRGPNDEGFLLNGYNYGSNSKLYLSRTSYHQDIADATIGMHINLDGQEIKTYSSSGLHIKNSLNNTIATFGDTGLSASLSGTDDGEIPVGGGTVTLSNTRYSNAYYAYTCYIRLVGSNYDYRYVYVVSHDGYGSSAHAEKLSTLRGFNNTSGGVSDPSISFDSNSSPVVTLDDSDRVISVISRRTAIGAL